MLIATILYSSTILVPLVKSESSDGSFYVTSSASDGGSISPSGTNSYSYLSNPSFTITPSAENRINEISVDGGKPLPATYFICNQSCFDDSTYKNIELTTVNNQRYILASPWEFSHFTIYEANSSWMPTSKIAISPTAINYLYVPSISKIVKETSLFPNCIVACGNQADGEGFVALYNITANSWIWESVPSISYLTDVLNPSGTDLLIHVADESHRGFVKTTTEHLFNSNSWEFVNLPASQTYYLGSGFLDTEIAYFKGSVFTFSNNGHYHNPNSSFSWCVYKYDLAEDAWYSPDPILYNIDSNMPGADSLYGTIWAGNSTLLFAAPFSNGTWSIYYSTDGSTFEVISSVASANSFHGYPSTPNAEHAWASTFEGNSNYILFDTVTDHDTNGYLAILDLNGTVIYKQTGFTAHYTQATQWLEETTPEGKVFLAGSTCDTNEYPAVIRNITIEYHSRKPFTFTFNSISSNHTINASFNNPSIPSPSPYQNQFFIESNSTISAMSLNATIPEITFTVNGTEGTTGYVNATISKSMMPNGDNIKINVDGNLVNCTITSNQDWWIIYFTYHHSTHQVKIYQTQNSSTISALYLALILAAVVIALLGFLGLIVWSAKTGKLQTPTITP